MAFPFPPDNNQPIPNDPFYYPDTNYIKGEYGPFIVGSGFTINNATGTIEVSGGGSGAPTILAGPGILVTAGTGTVTITNSGIRTVTAGAGIAVSVSAGNLNITNTAPAPGAIGTVTQVDAGTGLTGGPITTTGTLSLAPVTTVSPGTYTNPTITVDAYGRVTYAAPGSGALGSLIQATAPLSVNASIPQTISISPASTAAPGAVQLNTSTSSTSTTQAATPSAVKQAFDLATTAAGDASFALSTANTAAISAAAAQTTANNALATATSAQASAVSAQTTANTALNNAAAAQLTAYAAIPCASFTAKGQVLAATGSGTYGTVGPGTNGQVLVACTACTTGMAWVTQPTATGTVTSVSTGPGLIGGPITTTGTISLATTGVTPNTYTYANVSVDAYGRVTAAGCGVPPIPCACITGKGAIITGLNANSPVALPVGPNGRVLTACSSCPEGITWAPAPSSGIPCSCITGKGALISGTAASAVSSVAVGSDGYVLTADSTAPSGLTWAPAAVPITSATPTVEGSVFAFTDGATTFGTALGFDALNTTATGPGNVAIGTSAGCSLTTGQLNTYIGAGAGCANTTGNNNVALGGQALFAQDTGCGNIAIGNLAGLSITTEQNNVFLGPYSGEVGCDNNVYIASGDGTLRMRVNENGAYDFGGLSYGTTGQVLTSGGPGSTPTWTTVASSGGTVTSVATGVGLTGGPITTTGTIALASTTVAAGSYTNASFTVDPQGRLTAASSGTAPVTSVTGTAPIAVTAGTTPVVSISAASTTASGAVQLYDNVDSTSTTLALTAAQGKNLQDQITALSVAGTVELAGTVDASVGGILLSVTSVGTADGYVVGNTLPAASATTNNTYVIVTTPGTMTPPGGSPTATTRGDWFLVSETSPGVYAWTFLNVGFDVSYATTTSSGVVCLSTNALAQAGTDTTTALTPATAASAYIPKACVTAKGSLITGTAASTPVALPVGTDNTYLKANSACPNGLEWSIGMGDTPIGTVNWFAASTAPIGWLVADGRAVSRTTYSDLFAVVGTTYGTGDGSTTFNLPDLRGQFLRGWDAAGGTARGCDTGRAFGSSQQDMIECHKHVMPWGENGLRTFGQTTSNNKLGIATGQDSDNYWWYTNDGTNYDGVLNPAGVIGCETRPMNVAMLPCIKWQMTTAPSSCGIPCACVTAAGTLITGNAANSPVSLAVGANGTALIACSACSEGLTWANVVPVNATPTTAGVILGCTTSGVAALGCNALGGNAFGALCGHVAIGTCALYSTTNTSYNNVAIGVCSQALTTSGNSNVAIGFCSLALNTTGSLNVAIGDKALSKTTTADASTAVGANALACFTGTSVSTNDAFGANALAKFVCGDYNVSIGGWSMFNAICGNWNTAVGHRALTGLTCACKNAALGLYAGSNITTGCQNVAIGHAVTVCSATGNCQLAIGFDAGCNWLTGDSSKNIRPGAGITDCAGSVGGAGQLLCSTGTAIQWTNNGKMVSGFVNDVGTAGQWVEIDGIQFGLWTGCRSFVMRAVSGTLTASWSSCYQGGTVNFGAATYQDLATASPNWRFLVANASFPGHGTVQQATICVAASGGFTRAMYQFCGIIGASYIGNGISVTRIA